MNLYPWLWKALYIAMSETYNFQNFSLALDAIWSRSFCVHSPLIKPEKQCRNKAAVDVLCNYPERVIKHRTEKSRLAVMLPRRFPRFLSVGIHRLVISFRNFLRALLFKANTKSLLIDFERNSPQKSHIFHSFALSRVKVNRFPEHSPTKDTADERRCRAGGIFASCWHKCLHRLLHLFFFYNCCRLETTRPIHEIALLKLNEKNATGRSTPPWCKMWKDSRAWLWADYATDFHNFQESCAVRADWPNLGSKTTKLAERKSHDGESFSLHAGSEQTPVKFFRECARYLNFADRLTALHISWTKHSWDSVEHHCKRLPATKT